MKIIITSTSDSLDAKFDLRFGRAQCFCICNQETGECEFIKNDFANEDGGTASKISELVANKQVTKVISGDFGVKAIQILKQANVQMIMIEQGDYSVQDIINKIKQ